MRKFKMAARKALAFALTLLLACATVPNIAHAAGLTISGKIIDIRTHAPLENVKVTLAKSSEPSNILANVYTDEEGQYSITDVTPYAEYRIQGELAHYSTITEDRVYMQEENLQKDLSMHATPYRLSGTVVDKATGNPIAGAWVSAIDPGTGETESNGKTGADGKFTVVGVYAQQYIFSVEMNGYCEIRDEYTVTGDASDMVFQMEERLTYNVTGLIFEKFSSPNIPIEGAQVVIKKWEGDQTVEVARTTTGPDGMYAFRDLEKGSYGLEVSKAGYIDSIYGTIHLQDRDVRADVSLYKGEIITDPTEFSISGKDGKNEVALGESLQMVATIKPDSLSDSQVVWTVINGTGKASISEEGLLTGEQPGEVTVRALWIDSMGPYADMTVTVTQAAAEDPKNEGKEDQPKAISIRKGVGAIWTQESNEDLQFVLDAESATVTEILVDGKTLSRADYLLSEDGTVVTLKQHYLSTLNAGSHQIEILFAEGKTSAEFTIKVPESSLKTGDMSNAGLWTTLLFLSAAVMILTFAQKKRRA